MLSCTLNVRPFPRYAVEDAIMLLSCHNNKKNEEDLEKTIDLASLSVDIDVQVSGCGRQARNRLDVGC
jgi:hypothetical protein